jgi:hypothetical protein
VPRWATKPPVAAFQLSLLAALLFTVACIAVLALKAGGIIKLRWGFALSWSVVLALAAWGCLWLAAGIIANV